MRQLIYALQFAGTATPVEGAANVMKAATGAPSCTLTTSVGRDGVRGTLEPAPGERATFESTVTLAQDGTFQESGTISFGSGGHRLRFRTVGQGHLGPSADPKLNQGAVIWQVEGGEGQFVGARGLITSNFFIREGGEVTDNHFGVLFVE
jgi:hypothetical protein